MYRPIAANVAMYDRLYKEYEILHDYFGRGANDVMKRLKALKVAPWRQVAPGCCNACFAPLGCSPG